MDKLRGLLKELGGTDELIGAIAEEFSNYANKIKAQYDHEFHEKIKKARAICLEEINKEKAALARKLAIYVESKTEHFERAAEKQRLNEEAESANLLKRLKALMEGVSLEDGGQSRDLQVTRRQLARLQQAVGTLREERDLAVHKANKANEIARDVLQKNRLLESKVKQGKKVVSESKKGGPSSRNKTSRRTVLAESSKAPRRPRLDESRRVPSQPNSTRRVLEESQRRSSSSNKKGPGDSKISNIAASMED